MTAQITELIEGQDVAELVRDTIAAILAVETASQVALATEAEENPALWALDVYVERANPFSAWLELDDGVDLEELPPIVNVWLESTDQLEKGSAVDGQQGRSVVNVDCFGFGVSRQTDTGHLPADKSAAYEAQRAARLCRRILCSGHYTYLGSPRREGQFVFRRRLSRLEMFQPDAQVRPVGRVMGARLSFEITHSLEQPQVQGQALELITATVKRAEDDKIIVTASYDFTDA